MAPELPAWWQDPHSAPSWWLEPNAPIARAGTLLVAANHALGNTMNTLTQAEPQTALAPVTAYLPVELSGRRCVETRWYRNAFDKPLDFSAADFQPFAAARQCVTETPWGQVASRKQWDFDIARYSVAARVLVCHPYRVARSKSEQLLEALDALGWERCEEPGGPTK